MGLLSEGSPLSWEETKKWCDHVRKHGVQQFIHQWNKLKDTCKPELKWGDEVEYMLVAFKHEEEEAKLLLKAGPVLDALQEMEKTKPDDHPTTWRPEYAAYMVEGTPGKPYGGLLAHFNNVEANMRLRREEVIKLLNKNETALSLTAFPRTGCLNFSEPPHKATPEAGPKEGASRSLFYPDEVIFQGHPRFKTLTRNIRHRRKEKVIINIPVFKDTKTKEPFIEDFSVLGDDGEAARAAKPDHIYMDCMGFGMGCSCLQMTFQACNIAEARSLYDQLTPLTPIFLALSAASPIHRGFLSDIDCRWNIISSSVDCRTREERGLEPLKENKFRIQKSRYASTDSYLSPCGEKYNDIELVMDKDIYKTLINAGIDHLLAQHIAHLFIRDPVALFSEKIHQSDTDETDHFENLQSTNWQTMRFKPPPPNSGIGWRVEFRPVEVQLTDFENAAFVVFIVLMTRVILSFNLDFLIPISKVDENMETSQKKDAAVNGKFWFKKDPFTRETPPECATKCKNRCRTVSECMEDEYRLMTADEIINGSADFPGLVELINMYLDNNIECDVDTRCTILQYVKLIKARASGELKTTAKWMRDFVTSHPDYKQDSIVSEKINYDLIKLADQITRGEKECPELIFCHNTRSTDNIPRAMEKSEEQLISKKKMSKSNGVDVPILNGTTT
ncbi:unnamed protein product [Owenia fusiformis]|uniref:Glutamate--cysteine ligase n=1 Tax=Owenia fusiformis TaxID=6347 RepID=A0A8J1UT05_OWEFU|nr:unnamed protein product [Owenia fusiformis]